MKEKGAQSDFLPFFLRQLRIPSSSSWKLPAFLSSWRKTHSLEKEVWITVQRRSQLVLESSRFLQFLLLSDLEKQRDHLSRKELLFAPLMILVARQKEE